VPIDLDAANAAISGSREGLLAAGFTVECSDQDGRLLVNIRAQKGACEECLVPKRVLTAILERELGEGGVQVEGVEVVYPVEVHDELG
jgi:hypothetical protein